MPITRVLAIVLAVGAVLAPCAQATAPTTTTIGVPSSGSLGLMHAAGGTYLFTVSGTTDVGTGSVDVYCYFLDAAGAQARAIVTLNVPVAADKTFTTNIAGALPVAQNPCTLLAVAHGTNPVSLAPFHGPVLTAAVSQEFVQSGGPNDGKKYEYYDAASMSRGYADFESPSGCGIDYSRPFLPAGASLQQEGPNVFDCNGWYPVDEQVGPSAYRPAIRIDGHPAMNPSAARQLQVDGAWPALAHSVTVDPATGRLTVTEDEAIVECATNPAPAAVASGNCPPFATDGVSLHRTQVLDHAGRIITQTEQWSSTTGAHTLDLASQEYFVGDQRVQQFPGEPALARHTTQYATVAIPASAHPASILDQTDASLADGSAANPRTSTSMWPVPDQAIMTGTDGSNYLLHYSLMIPASGTLTITRIYAQDFLAADLAGLTHEAEDRLEGPSVAINAPADGTTVNAPGVVVSGSTADNGGAPSVTVNGQATAVSSGSFSTNVTLAEGLNAITVVATDATGNTATATRAITYTKPVVPPPPAKPAISGNGTVACPTGGAACTASGTWTSRQAFAAAKRKQHKVVLAKWHTTIQPGKTAKAKLTLTAAGKRLLRKRSVAATRAIAARAGTGTPVTRSAKVTLHRLRKKKH